jgi:hypothetical protein
MTFLTADKPSMSLRSTARGCFVAVWRRHFRQINCGAAKIDTGREALQQASDQNKERR